MNKLIVCSVLPGGEARVQAWAPGGLGDALRRQRRVSPEFLVVAAFAADVRLFKRLVGWPALPVLLTVERAAELFHRSPIELATQRLVFRHNRSQAHTGLLASWFVAVGEARVGVNGPRGAVTH